MNNKRKHSILVVQNEYGKLSEIFLNRFYIALRSEFTTRLLVRNTPSTQSFPFGEEELRSYKYPTEANRILSRLVKKLRLPLDYTGVPTSILNEINTWNCDLVCFQMAYLPVALGPKLNRVNKRICLFHHGSDVNEAVENTFYRERLKKVWDQCEKVVFPSQFLLDQALQLGCREENAHVHYLGVPINENRVTSEINGTFRFICVARLAPVKNHLTLIRSFERVLREVKENIELVLIGEGELKNQIEKEINALHLNDKVRMLGGLSNQDTLSEIADSNCSVLISKPHRIRGYKYEEEALGLSLIEGGAQGLPMIGSNSGGIPEIIEHGVNGYLVDPYNINEIKEAMLMILKKHNVRETLGVNAREKAEEKFNLERQNKKLVALFNDIIVNN